MAYHEGLARDKVEGYPRSTGEKYEAEAFLLIGRCLMGYKSIFNISVIPPQRVEHRKMKVEIGLR